MYKDIIDQYNKAIFEVYKKQGLVSLEDNGFKYKGINVLQCPINPDYNEPKFQPTINLWDIVSCNKDLKFFVGQLFLYRDLINNPLEELMPIENGKLISTYYQNLYDHRYCSFITCCFEKSYNFWDRIGDTIASFFPDLLKIHQVDFSRIIDQIKTQQIEIEHFFWLLNFKENEYQELNRYRKDFVNYYQFESKYRYDHSMNLSDLIGLEKIWAEKYGFPEYFKKHLELSSEGYYQMFSFLEKIQNERNQSKP